MIKRKELEAEIEKLILLLKAVRPYVEYCAEGSWYVKNLLREIDELNAK